MLAYADVRRFGLREFDGRDGWSSPEQKRGRGRVAIGTIRSVRGVLQKRRRFLH